MGTFRVEIEIGDPDGERWESVNALVDTGASFTWVPRDVLERLGVQPEFRRQFETANGRIVERDVAQAPIRLDSRQLTTIVVFGDADSQTRLGRHTLDLFGVAPDEDGRRLIRVPALAVSPRLIGDAPTPPA